MNENRKLDGYEEETDDRTAIVSLKELKAPRKQSKDRHLLVRVRGAELGRVTLLSPERVRVGRSQDSELWLSDDGLREVWRLTAEVNRRSQENGRLAVRNSALEAEVADLKQGMAAAEERARTELGMIQDGETFYQIAPAAPPRVREP